MAKQKQLKFKVLQPIWSIWHQAYFQADDIITYPVLSPLAADAIENPYPNYPDLQKCQELGILEPFQEINDGKNSPDETENR